MNALLADLETELPRIWGRGVGSVFIGGGTPSLFRPESVSRILEAIASVGALSPDAEITLEANPGASERGQFEGFARAGVNRISLGGQSFSADYLATLGRIHGPDDTLAAAQAVHEAGIEQLNIDLMYGLPGQSVEGAVDDVRTALAAGPTHVSHYQLTIEPNTVFHARPPVLPDDERCWDMMDACEQVLADSGFERYEVSAFARPGNECRHNLGYWRFADYAAIGAGAHQKLTHPSGRIERVARVAHPRQYLEQAGGSAVVAERRTLEPDDAVFEFMLNVLRLRQPFASGDFTRRTGVSEDVLETRLKGPLARGLMRRAGAGNWQVTPLGHRFLNDLQASFLPEV